MSTHRARWQRDWTDARTDPPYDVDVLLARYREPHRAYHTIQHLDECFTWLEQVRSAATAPHLVSLAIWYHDAIYDPRGSSNEQDSAELALDALRQAGAGTSDAEAVRDLILATRHTLPPAAGDPSLLVDIDLAILGAPVARFEEYQRQIRQEYRWVPGPIYRRRRAAVLRGFLDRPVLYRTALLRQALDDQARRNLEAALSKLGGAV